jgi:hypothetical protein
VRGEIYFFLHPPRREKALLQATLTFPLQDTLPKVALLLQSSVQVAHMLLACCKFKIDSSHASSFLASQDGLPLQDYSERLEGASEKERCEIGPKRGEFWESSCLLDSEDEQS